MPAKMVWFPVTTTKTETYERDRKRGGKVRIAWNPKTAKYDVTVRVKGKETPLKDGRGKPVETTNLHYARHVGGHEATA